MPTSHRFASLPLIAAMASLAACGGGGDAGPGGGGTTPPVVTPANTPLVTSVPSPTYAPGSQELAAFNLLNAERERCGFGLVAQDTQLDQASRGHADWMLRNNFFSHTQTSGSLLFTGFESGDRIAATGYANNGQFYSWDEFVVWQGSSSMTDRGISAVRGLLNAPYHAAGMLDAYKDIGISIRRSADVTSPHPDAIVAQFNPANKIANGFQEPPAGTIRTYPCEGSTGVRRNLTSETPNPVPGRNLQTNPLGTTISIRTNMGDTLSITSANMINLTTGAPVTLRAAVVSGNDVHGLLSSNQAFISADAAMDANTSYQASISGTNNGQAFSRTFIFTTGQ